MRNHDDDCHYNEMLPINKVIFYYIDENVEDILIFQFILNNSTNMQYHLSTMTKACEPIHTVGTVYLPSFTSFARDSKWGCRL